jgi:hypothetical protein
MREEWTALCWDALNEYFTNLVAVPQVAMSDGLLGFLDTTQKYCATCNTEATRSKWHRTCSAESATKYTACNAQHAICNTAAGHTQQTARGAQRSTAQRDVDEQLPKIA